MTIIQSSSHEDLEFDGENLETMFEDTDCWLVALDDWDIAVILSSLRYAHWPRRWRNLGGHTWDEIEAKISNLEYCLMAGCNVDALLDKFDTLNLNLVANNEDVIEAINNLTEQFIFREGEEVQDITYFVRSLANTLSDLKYDLRYLLLTYGDKSISQIISELPIAGITTAIENQELTSICSPDVNVTCGGGGCGGCGGGETEMPQEPGTIGQTPPDGYEEYPPEFINLSHCKLVYALLSEMENVIAEFVRQDVLGTILKGGILITLAITIIYAIIASGMKIFGFAVTDVVGAISEIIKILTTGQSSDLISLQEAIITKRTELACVLYNASEDDSILDIRAQFNAVLIDGGCTEIGVNISNAILTIEVYDVLYWNPVWKGIDIEAQLENYTGEYDCSSCLDEGVFDFTLGELGWLIDETGSTNGDYDDENGYFWGSVSGAGTALLTIYYPVEKVTINTLRMWVYGTLQQIDSIIIRTADDYEGEWTNVDTKTNVSTPGEESGFTIVEFTDLDITDKYIEIYLNRFWSNAAVLIQRVEWE